MIMINIDISNCNKVIYLYRHLSFLLITTFVTFHRLITINFKISLLLVDYHVKNIIITMFPCINSYNSASSCILLRYKDNAY